MSSAVLFPGQGSQHVGMGEDLFERHADRLGEDADRILGWSLRDVCLDGPEERLTRTEFAQPALFALSYARWLDVEAHLADHVSAAAGHSLGEYTALAAAGMIGYEAALAVVAERGAAMSDAADAEPSGMAALIGATPEVAEEVAAARRAAGGRLSVANLNAPGQVVVAGGADDLDWLEENARSFGIRRAIRLNVAGAFHSPFMSAATARLASASPRCRGSTSPVPRLQQRDGSPGLAVGGHQSAGTTGRSSGSVSRDVAGHGGARCRYVHPRRSR